MVIPPDLKAALDRILAEGRPVSMDDLNAQLQAAMGGYNTRPQAALGGISPDALYRLLQGDWQTTGPLRVAEDIPAARLRDVPFYADARTLLEYIAEHGPVKLTAAGYLPRAAMHALIPRLRISRYPGMRSEIPIGKAPKESDFPWVELVRATATFAGLITRRAGLRLSKQGRAMLVDTRAGALNALLFRTLFRKVDLYALFALDGYKGLQQTLAYTFYRLPLAARDWRRVDDLVESCWLETARDAPPAATARSYDMRNPTFEHRVLDPLVQFGLVEHRVADSPESWLDRGEYRVTELYDRVLQVKLGR